MAIVRYVTFESFATGLVLLVHEDGVMSWAHDGETRPLATKLVERDLRTIFCDVPAHQDLQELGELASRVAENQELAVGAARLGKKIMGLLPEVAQLRELCSRQKNEIDELKREQDLTPVRRP